MEPAHTLLLIDSRSTSRRVLYKYGRHVDLLWSPVSDALVINDYEGSNSAKPVLFDLVTGSVGIDLKGEFLRLRDRQKTLAGPGICKKPAARN